MEAAGSHAALTLMNRDFKLDRFDGTDYNRWKDQMMFLLTALKISYVLSDTLPAIPEPSETEEKEVTEERKKREEDELLCRGHILNRLSDRLYNLFTAIKSPKEIWKTLESRYTNEKQGTDKFLIMKYFEFFMSADKPILDQVHDLQTIVNRLKELKVEICEALQVGAIIAKLPTTWNDYRKKLLHTTEDISLEQIQKHLRIEEDARNQYKRQVESKTDSKINFVGQSSNQNAGNNNNKRKNPNNGGENSNNNNANKKQKNNNNNNKGPNKAKCNFCKKPGHFQRDCWQGKKKQGQN